MEFWRDMETRKLALIILDIVTFIDVDMKQELQTFKTRTFLTTVDVHPKIIPGIDPNYFYAWPRRPQRRFSDVSFTYYSNFYYSGPFWPRGVG